MTIEEKDKKKSEWQLQEAKAMFSEVVKSANLCPQIITVHGKETAVVISYEEYKKLTSPKQNLFEFIQSSPLRDIKLNLPQRLPEEMREVRL
jgi:prevent-host-death family protein